jgi:hypothetical protein
MICAPCISGADPFLIPKQQLVAGVRTIGILPTINNVNGTEASAMLLNERLADGLRAAGFEVRGAELYRSIEAEARQAGGGWFDPFTGRANLNKRAAILARAMDTYQSHYRVDAFLRAQIEEVPLRYLDEKHVHWDGVEENIVVKEGLIAFINHADGFLDHGQIPAITLLVALYDTQGKRLYSAAGGIGTRSAVVNKQFVSVDVSSLLGDSARLAQAAEVALRPLSKGGEPAKAPVRSVGIGTLLTSPDSIDTSEAEAASDSTRTEIQNTVKTIAIVPIDLNDSPHEETVRAIYQDRLVQSLKAAGYNVVSRWTYERAFTDAAEQAGGIYDPISGGIAAEKLAKAREIHTRTLRDEYHVDALLYFSFPTVALPFSRKGLVEWDGLSRSALTQDAPVGGSNAIWGRTTAISLSARLTDLTGKVLYSKRAGIDLLAQFTGTYFRSRSKMQILQDEEKASAPIRNAVSGLTDN